MITPAAVLQEPTVLLHPVHRAEVQEVPHLVPEAQAAVFQDQAETNF